MLVIAIDAMGPLGSLPAGLKVLRFDCNLDGVEAAPAQFTHPLGALPEGLEVLHLPAGYAHPLGLLPPTLQQLRLPRTYRHQVHSTGHPVMITHYE